MGAGTKYGDLKPMSAINPPPLQQQQQQTRNHSHSRTVSSNIFPLPQATTSPPPNTMTPYQYTINNNRRTPSNATSSSKASTLNNSAFPVRTNSSMTNSNSLRRSTSSRSGQSITPTSYVALMRKQKATVWCDRSQPEDPKITAQQKAAKHRITLDVIGNNAQFRSSTSTSMGSGGLGVRSKIRHHTAPRASYGSAGIGGVPMRLSASEVDDQGADEDADSQRNLHHGRNGSGRSSFVSNSRLAGYPQRFSSGRVREGSTPGERFDDDLHELDPGDTPVPGERQRSGGGDYFQQASGNSGSGSSSEREASFGNAAEMNAPVAAAAKKEEGKSWEELNRRGSVDERAATMRGAQRLFVANPDLSDSD